MDSARWNSFDALLLVVAAALLFFGLGSNSLHNEDEGRYALAQMRIVETGDWLDFEVQGETWMNKAPLRVWASAALALVAGGVDEWTVRLPSAIAALGVIAALMWLGRLLYEGWAARWAALVSMTSTQFLYHHGARTGEMESFLLLVWVLAVCFAVKTRDDVRWWIASLACVGLAGMVKHLFYVVPVGGVALAALVFTGTWRTIPARVWAMGLLAFTSVLVPWHAAMVARYGQSFVDVYLGREVAGRVAERLEYGHPLHFYPSVIEDGLFPWSYLLPFALLAFVRTEPRRAPGWLLAVWALPMVVGPALARMDFAWYALPALPAIALFLGRWLSRTELPAWVALASALLFLLSPSNVHEFDALNTRAALGMIGVQTLGLVRGASVWAPQLVFGIFLVLLAVRLWRAPARARRGWILPTWALFALIHAAAPLHAYQARSPIDTLVSHVAERGFERDRYVALYVPNDELRDLYAFALRGLPSPAQRIGVGMDPLPEDLDAAWVIGPLAVLEAFGEPTIVVGGWGAIAPRVTASTPPGTVPRGSVQGDPD